MKKTLEKKLEKIRNKWRVRLDGGKGSGNWGHAGRPGKVGGSQENPESAFNHRYTDAKTGAYTSFAKEKKKAATPHQSSANELKSLPVGSRVIDGKNVYEKLDAATAGSDTKWINVYTGEVIGSYTLNKDHLWGKDIKVAIPASAEPELKGKISSSGSMIGEKKSSVKKSEEEEPKGEEMAPEVSTAEEEDISEPGYVPFDDEAFIPEEDFIPYTMKKAETEEPTEAEEQGENKTSETKENKYNIESDDDFFKVEKVYIEATEKIAALTDGSIPYDIMEEYEKAGSMEEFLGGDYPLSEDEEELFKQMSEYIEVINAEGKWFNKKYGSNYEPKENVWQKYLDEHEEELPSAKYKDYKIETEDDYKKSKIKKFEIVDNIISNYPTNVSSIVSYVEKHGVDEVLGSIASTKEDKDKLVDLMSDYYDIDNAQKEYEGEVLTDKKNPFKEYKKQKAIEEAKKAKKEAEKAKEEEKAAKEKEEKDKAVKELDEKYKKALDDYNEKLAKKEETHKKMIEAAKNGTDEEWNAAYDEEAEAKADFAKAEKVLADIGNEYKKLGKIWDEESGTYVDNPSIITKFDPSEVFGTGSFSEERVKKADFHTLDESWKEYAPVASEVWGHLNQDEKDQLYRYTKGSSYCNEPLTGRNYYGGKASGKQDITDSINDITSAIDKAVIPNDCIMAHGIGRGGFRAMFNISESEDLEEAIKARIGMVGYNGGFFSCGLDKMNNFATMKPVIMDVFVPKGAKGMYVEPFSWYGKKEGQYWDGDYDEDDGVDGENEVILQRGGFYKLTGVAYEGGYLRVKCELVGQDPSKTTQEEWEKNIT